jgi:hypothetical protein
MKLNLQNNEGEFYHKKHEDGNRALEVVPNSG